MTPPIIAVAFPIAEGQREIQRQLAGRPLPALYRQGAETRPCTVCKMELNVGPRVLASGAPIYCMVCAMDYARSQGEPDLFKNVVSLGNPESRDETES